MGKSKVGRGGVWNKLFLHKTMTSKEILIHPNLCQLSLQKVEGLEIGLAVKSAECSPRGPDFESQHPHGSSETSVTPVRRDPIPSFDLLRHQKCTWVYRHISKQNTHIHEMIK